MWKDQPLTYKIEEIWLPAKVQFGPNSNTNVGPLYAEVLYQAPLFQRNIKEVRREHMHSMDLVLNPGPESMFHKSARMAYIEHGSLLEWSCTESGLELELNVTAVMIRPHTDPDLKILATHAHIESFEQARSLPVTFLARAALRAACGDRATALTSFSNTEHTCSRPAMFANITADESKWHERGYIELKTLEEAKVYANQLGQVLLAKEELALEEEYACRKQAIENVRNSIMRG